MHGAKHRPANSLESGTFGGWVTDMNTKQKFGLTAGHVTMGNLKGRVESFLHIVKDVPIVQPSDADFRESLSVADINATNKCAESEMLGFQHPRLERVRITAEEMVKGISALESTRFLGKVMAAFVGVEKEVIGTFHSRHHRKNYALIESIPRPLTPSRGMQSFSQDESSANHTPVAPTSCRPK